MAGDPFGRYFQDLESPELNSALEKHGVVTFQWRDRAQLHDVVSGMGTINMRRDSDADGVTVVEHVPGVAGREGFQGMSSAGLELHTDGAGWPDPPRYILLACERDAGTGGESTFVDGWELHEALTECHPDSLAALSRAGSVVFRSRGEDSYVGSVFQRGEGGELTVRLRLDSLGCFAFDVLPHLDVFQRVAAANLWTMKLQPGQGYIIDNHRIFHGRRSFRGERRMLRLRFDPATALDSM